MNAASAARCYVALGANLNDPVEQVRRGIAALARLPRSRFVAASSLYRTAPVGVVGQPDYINAVAAIETGLSAQQLLEQLHRIEQRAGRERHVRWAARTLDLDLLLYAHVQIHEPGLTVPHPRMHERAFVLHPLLEIAPDIQIPGLGPAQGALAVITDQAIEVLA